MDLDKDAVEIPSIDTSVHQRHGILIMFNQLHEFEKAVEKSSPKLLYKWRRTIGGPSPSFARGFLHEGILHVFEIPNYFPTIWDYKEAQKIEISHYEPYRQFKEETEEAEKAGFDTRKEYLKAREKGFTKKEEYVKAKRGGFETYTEYCSAKDAGFEKAKEHIDAQEKGFDNRKEYIIAMKGGFETYEEFYRADIAGFNNREEWIEFRDSGFTTKEQFFKAKEYGIGDQLTLTTYVFLGKLNLGEQIALSKIAKKTGILQEDLERVLKEPAIARLGVYNENIEIFSRQKGDEKPSFQIDLSTFAFKTAVVDGNNVAYHRGKENLNLDFLINRVCFIMKH